MKFFLDTANLDELRKGAAWGIVNGVTTNPSLIAKEGKPIEEQVRRICDIVNGPISAEVVATEFDGMVKQAHELSAIHPNIVVKVPLTRDGIRTCATLCKQGIRFNLTLCFSAAQALLAAKPALLSSARSSAASTTSPKKAWPGQHHLRHLSPTTDSRPKCWPLPCARLARRAGRSGWRAHRYHAVQGLDQLFNHP